MISSASCQPKPFPSTRLCRSCEVKWLGLPDSTCWLCDGPAYGLDLIFPAAFTASEPAAAT